MTATAPVHDRLAILADPTRGRILLALDQHALTVGELCAVLSVPQSTVSRHLKVLADDNWVSTRQEGTSRFYSRTAVLDAGAERLWSAVADDLRLNAQSTGDLARLSDVIAQRRTKSREFFSGVGASWEEVRREIFGGAVGGGALLGLLDPRWTVGDLGCGSGHLAALLAPFVARVIGVDGSPEMLAGARARVGKMPNVDLRAGDLESLPVETGALDAAVLSLVLHHAPDPVRVLREARRVLTAGGRLLVIDLQPHERIDYRDRLGHVWLGFSAGQVTDWMTAAGFSRPQVVALPWDEGTKQPALFVASAMAGPGNEQPTTVRGRAARPD